MAVSRSHAGGEGSPGQVLPARAGTWHQPQPCRVLGTAWSLGCGMGAGSVVAQEHSVLTQGVMITAYAGY